MIKVVEKETFKVVDVYDITYDTNGYPLFLIYEDGQWFRRGARHYEPVV